MTWSLTSSQANPWDPLSSLVALGLRSHGTGSRGASRNDILFITILIQHISINSCVGKYPQTQPTKLNQILGVRFLQSNTLKYIIIQNINTINPLQCDHPFSAMKFHKATSVKANKNYRLRIFSGHSSCIFYATLKNDDPSTESDILTRSQQRRSNIL